MHVRRQLLVLGAAALAAPFATIGQGKPRRVAWLGVGRAGTPSLPLESFRAGLREWGWIEGRNLALDVFFTEGTLDVAEGIGRRMLATEPELLVVFGRDVPVAKRLKPACPVVFAFSGNPVDAGIVKSFARPSRRNRGWKARCRPLPARSATRWSPFPTA